MRSSDDPAPNQQSRPQWNEAERLTALRQYGILDTAREIEFDDVVRIAAHVCKAPIAVVNLIAEGRPEEVAMAQQSYTGQFLREALMEALAEMVA